MMLRRSIEPTHLLALASLVAGILLAVIHHAAAMQPAVSRSEVAHSNPGRSTAKEIVTDRIVSAEDQFILELVGASALSSVPFWEFQQKWATHAEIKAAILDPLVHERNAARPQLGEPMINPESPTEKFRAETPCAVFVAVLLFTRIFAQRRFKVPCRDRK